MMRGLAGKPQMTADTLPSEPGALVVWPRLSCPLGAAAFVPSPEPRRYAMQRLRERLSAEELWKRSRLIQIDVG